MLSTVRSLKGMVTSPHHLASQAGLDILRRGGCAAEAAVATAAALAVVYPHMNALGGDSFWLLGGPGQEPVGVDASGRAAQAAEESLYRSQGLDAVPRRGGLAANTVAGTLSGWARALEVGRGGARAVPLSQLLAEAVRLAEEGVAVTGGLADVLAAKGQELGGDPGFAAVFLPDGKPLRRGATLRQPALGRTLRRLGSEGLDSFYRGALAADLAAQLQAAGSPVSLADLHAHRAADVTPLRANVAGARLYNMPAPTQGVASLMILLLFDRLAADRCDSFEHVHGLVEATKHAFRLRDAQVGDPDLAPFDLQAALNDAVGLDAMARGIDPRTAAPWPQPPSAGDTVWFGAMDADGRCVSAIQSLYFEFGSGIVLPQTGVTWQNRGSSFVLGGAGPNRLRPGAKPFHTLNPAMALFDDGRCMVYGAMGGEGQPQTQAAIFTRYARYGQDLQQAVTAPRWLLGRTWGDESVTLKLEDRFSRQMVDRLRAAGHAVEIVAPFTEVMGHAGALVRHADGALEGATDPRSDGAVAAW